MLQDREVRTTETTIFATIIGQGPPVLLLHGFPENRRMWLEVATRLADTHTVVCADLPGYGQSGCPPSASDHHPYAKRAMAVALIEVMAQLGHPHFSVVGHDRGGRVAYRMALDHPEQVTRAAVLDIVPTEEAWARADDRFSLGYWPWSLLAQPEPLAEEVLAGAGAAILDAALANWGTPAATFSAERRAEYAAAVRDPARAHAICEEYRAGAGIDRDHERADLAAGHRIGCPLLVLWSASGPLGSWYEDAGGPLGLWRRWATQPEGEGVEGGHFFPEEQPEETARRLGRFLTGRRAD
jgi:haloacetate dehalogenase